MDAIDRAIEKGKHITTIASFRNSTWHNFDQVAAGKRVILFGVGEGADFYYHKYGEKAFVDAIVDNDQTWQGELARDVINEQIDSGHQDMRILGVTALRDNMPEQTVVLIASLNHYEEIAMELEQYGFCTFFSLLCMEALFRKKHGILEMEDRREKLLTTIREYPIQENKVCVVSMFKYAGHAKEIVKQLLRLRDDVDIVWIQMNDTHMDIPACEGIHFLKWRMRRACITALASAKIWIMDAWFHLDVRKRPGQYVVQVKHWASITLKMFGNDEARYRHDESLIAMNNEVHEIQDFIIVGSEFDEKTCRSGFDFSGRVLYAGSPRSDALFRRDEALARIEAVYPVIDGKRILLYAPTFRLGENKQYDAINYYLPLDFSSVKMSLEKTYGGNWLFFLRLHPSIAARGRELTLPEYVLDVSEYYDSEELVAISDVMITDYSSIMFEPAFVRKPVFLLVPDRETYTNEERGFLLDFDSLPFPIASTNEELSGNIENFDNAKYIRDLDIFLEKYGVHEDGHAGERAAQFVLDMIDGKIEGTANVSEDYLSNGALS